MNVQLFSSEEDTQGKLERWRQDYNHCRPHSALGDLPPVAFAQRTDMEYNWGRTEAENLNSAAV